MKIFAWTNELFVYFSHQGKFELEIVPLCLKTRKNRNQHVHTGGLICGEAYMKRGLKCWVTQLLRKRWAYLQGGGAICGGLYSSFNGFWQSFVTIGSCNHLMRIISTYVGKTKKSEISWRCKLIKLDNQLWGVKRTLSYFLLVAKNKTIHSPTSRIVISFR